jgi:hypothetical protein
LHAYRAAIGFPVAPRQNPANDEVSILLPRDLVEITAIEERAQKGWKAAPSLQHRLRSFWESASAVTVLLGCLFSFSAAQVFS